MIREAFPAPARAEQATAIALVSFYAVGLAAHLFALTRPLMESLTTYALLAGGILVLAAAARSAESPMRFFLWCVLTVVGTLAAEAVGVRTGAVFGRYSYGDVLGEKILGVPPVIGFNWTLTVLGALLLSELWAPKASGSPARRAATAALNALSAGLLAALFDFALEPTAIALRYWSWKDGSVPLRNYAAWFVLSALAALLYRGLRPRVHSRLPVVYLALQWLFFLGIDVALARVNPY